VNTLLVLILLWYISWSDAVSLPHCVGVLENPTSLSGSLLDVPRSLLANEVMCPVQSTVDIPRNALNILEISFEDYLC